MAALTGPIWTFRAGAWAGFDAACAGAGVGHTAASGVSRGGDCKPDFLILFHRICTLRPPTGCSALARWLPVAGF